MIPALKNHVVCLTAIFCFVALALVSTASAQPQKAPGSFEREIFVPFESLDVLLDGNSNRVMLSKDEYQELLKAARTREIRRAPMDSAIVSAKYSGDIQAGVASIKGELIVEALNEGLVQIPLSFSGVAIRSAKLGDRPAKLWRDAKGQVVLLTSSEIRETLTVELTVPMQTSAARQSMAIQLPAPSASRFNLNVPGNVEVKSGIPVVNRTFNEDKNSTEFDLLMTQEPMNIVMSLNNRLLKDDQVVVSRSVLIHKLTSHVQEMHITCSVDVIHGAMEQIDLFVPNGFQVSQVSTALLNQWEIQDFPEGSGRSGKRLVVKLRQPTREDFVLSITASRNEGAVGDWTAQDIRPLDVAGHVSVVGVLADIELSSAKLASEGVIPIDHEFLMAAIPDSVKTVGQGNPVAVIAAYYAPQKEYSIASRFAVPPPELIVKSNSRLVIDNQRLELQGGLSLSSRNDARFSFRMNLPDGWRLNELTNLKNEPVKFDRVGTDGKSEFLVHLPGKIPTSGNTKVFFKASLTPQGWLEKWDNNQIQFPAIKVDGESTHSGAIAVSTSEDLKIKPSAVANLELLAEEDKKRFELDRKNAPLAYQFDATDYELGLMLTRLKPSLLARTYNYFTVEPNQLNVHSEVIYDVKQADMGEFQFDLPIETPKSIAIKANGDQLKDYSSEEMDGVRRWTVELAKPRKGKVHLLVDFAMPIDESSLADLDLNPIVVQKVNFQSSMVAVEGSTELDIEIETDGRSVDVGEFSEALYQPGRFMLGAFSWPDENATVKVISERRPVYQLPSAIVQRAEMVTSISTRAKAQTAARFQLVTKQQPFLRIELPTDATLWSVQLDGEPAKPQLQNEALLISLIGNETGKLRDLQLVYESPASSFQFVGTVQAQAPSLWLNETGNADGQKVPLVDLHWRLIMPDGFSVSHSDGRFQSDQLVERPSPIEQLGYWVYHLGGGIGRSPILPEVMVADTAKTADFSNLSMIPNSFESAGGGISSMEADEESEQAGEKLPPPPPLPPIPGNDQSGEGAPAFQAPADSPANQPARRPSSDQGEQLKDARKQAGLWALSGLRSLNIELTDTGNAIDFYNLGEQPELTATIVNHARLNWVAIALALFIAALGVLLTNRNFKSKFIFIFLVLLIACLVPLAGAGFDAFRTVVDLAILSAVFLVIYFVVAALFKLIGRSFSLVVARVPLLMLLIAVSIGFGNPGQAQEVVSNPDQLKKLIDALQTDPNVKLPDNAIIIPFDTDDPDGREKADKLLVPYQHYLDLINKANDDLNKNAIESPVGFVLSAAQYDVELTQDRDVSISGKLMIEVLTDDPVSVALPLIGGALADAKVDGKPAKLQFGTLPASAKQQKRGKSAANSNIVQLHLEGRGTKTFEFTVQIKPTRQGGWRMINARLPIGMTRGLNLTSLDEPAEVRLNSDADRRSIQAKPNQDIATVLSSDGSLRLQWKPNTSSQVVDQSLTANSEAIFDIREDGLRLTWRADLEFRGSERDLFTFELPNGFLVEQVNGENVRAWDIKSDEDRRQLNVTTLSAAKDRETFTIEMSHRDFSIGSDKLNIDAPYLKVEGAALHKGVYVVRRSPIIEVKATEKRAASRVDSAQTKRRIDPKSLDSKSSPLGIQDFQIMQFVTTPFKLGLQAKRIARTLTAHSQSILRIGQSEADLEMRVNVDVGERPIYKFSFELPKDVKIRRLSAGQNETWSTEANESTQTVQMFFPAGVEQDFSIVMDAALTAYSGAERWTIPKVKMNDVIEQTGVIAVQVDPAFNVTTSDLENCETILMSRIESWLNQGQRALTRVAMKTKGADYAATLNFSRIEPRVTVETVSNVRTTLFAIEETLLLDFNIQNAGIRKIEFEIPSSMRNARIIGKLLSESTIDEIVDNPNVVLVTLILQDDVIGPYRVVVENDRQLSENRQTVPVPNVRTGITQKKFATLQNAGRDEIEVMASQDFQKLNRQLKQFAALKRKIAGGEVTMAYVADANTASPLLQFETKRREVIDTVAASIEFSKTTMAVDSSGGYRALQNFQVNNRSEQYLEIEIPEGAQLLTVLVEGEPVKPVAWPGGQNERQLRIPLVKTAAGDLDYPVQLKYAGQLGDLNGFSEIEFPVIETLNINVQLSQLHLRLPDTHQWMNFGGTMTKVDSRGKLEESYLSYKRRQIEQLAEQIRDKSSKFGSFSKSRAYSNLKKLENEMNVLQSRQSLQQRSTSQSELQSLLTLNNDAIQQAQEIYSLENSKVAEIQVDNRANFNGLVEGQSLQIARNAVTKQGQNWQSFGVVQADDGGNGKEDKRRAGRKSKAKQLIASKKGFDREWLDRNKLNIGKNASKADSSKPSGQLNRPAIVRAQTEANDDDSINFVNPTDSMRLYNESRRFEQMAQNAGGESKDDKAEGGYGFRAGLRGQQGLGGVVVDSQGEAASNQSGGGGFGGGGGPQSGPDPFARGIPATEKFLENSPQRRITFGGALNSDTGINPNSPLDDAHLGSLDIDLPERGVDYYFKSPRGKATVMVRPIETRSFSRWMSALITIGVCVAVWGACWLVFAFCRRNSLRIIGLAFLLLAGLVSLVSGVLPVYGLIAVAASIILMVDWATRLMLESDEPEMA